MHKIKIINIATIDWDGAGIASQYFNTLLNNSGYKSILIVKNSKELKSNVLAVKGTPKVASGFFSKLKLRITSRFTFELNKRLYNEKYCYFNKDERKTDTQSDEIISKFPFSPDIIILHWTSNFINSNTVKEFAEKTNAKIFWLMMDNAPLTGGCHYPWECQGFHLDCSNCPAILVGINKKKANRNLAIKVNNLPDNLEIVACSESDYIRAKKSTLFRNRKIHKILLPVDETKFTGANMSIAKKNFGIPENMKVIFFGATAIKDTRKGISYFIEALLTLKTLLTQKADNKTDFMILIAGNGNTTFLDNINIPYLNTGYLDEKNLIKAYQAADVFISSSLEDSGPLMINQAIMCGTPVVSFDVGVAMDLVINGYTGYRVKVGDSKAMAEGIKSILSLSESEYNEISNNCRLTGLNNFSLDQTIRKWDTILQRG